MMPMDDRIGRSVMPANAPYVAVCFDLFGTLVSDDGVAFAGVVAALTMLPAERWAIVTSCGDALARALVRRAGLPEPRILVTADDVARTKPSAEPYRLAVARLKVNPARALAVEDSRDGLAAARAAGLDTLAILHGRGVAFARDALFVAERFADVRWSIDDGTIGFEIER